MRPDHRVVFYALVPALRRLAVTLEDSVLDLPATCPHREAVLLCAAHPDGGPMCRPCAASHLDDHSLLDDSRCSSCAQVGMMHWASIPGNEFIVLAKVCGRCSGRRLAEVSTS